MNKPVLFAASVLLAGCGGGGGGYDGGSSSGGSAAAYSVSGTISGLTGTVVLQNNGGDNLTVSANGPFTFRTPIVPGATYDVTVFTQPAGQVCTVANGRDMYDMYGSSSMMMGISVICR